MCPHFGLAAEHGRVAAKSLLELAPSQQVHPYHLQQQQPIRIIEATGWKMLSYGCMVVSGN